MNPSDHTYEQPEKKRARWLALCHAVESLTTHRQQSPVITLNHFDAMLKYACDLIERTNVRPCPHEQVKDAAARFKELHESRVGTKSAKDLTVLFLAGPNPINDLDVLTELGVAIQNIWAVESDDDAYKMAVESVFLNGSPLKLYRGSLHQFFEIVPQQFDIVYFDACSPLSSGKPNTLHVLRELFLRQRLTPLSVVITNFSEANFCLVEDENSKAQAKVWASRIGTWSFMRDEYEDFETDYFEHVQENLPDYYSDFTTRFVVEFAGLLIPWWRVAILPGAKNEYYANSALIKTAIRGKQEAGFSIEAMFFQDSFPAFLRIVDIAEEKLAKDDPLRQQLFDQKRNGVSLADAVRLAYFLRNAGDSIFSETADFNRKACNPELVEVLDSFKWFDQGSQLFCDEPGSHLIADLLLGLYGYPYHTNLNQLRRWKYTAKKIPMYLDVFVFDQARYLYDLIPTLPFVSDYLKFGEQLVLRACMDSIFRHNYSACPEWFYGATLAEMGQSGFTFHDWSERELIHGDSAT